MTKILDVVLLDMDQIHPNSWNPNVQDNETFDKLVSDIDTDGFHHPLNVIPTKRIDAWTEDKDHYLIVGGAHRFEAAKVLLLEQLPCFIHTDWSETDAKLKTVRLNMLTGDMDRAKFTALVQSLEDKVDIEAMPDLFGFKDSIEFQSYIIEEKKVKEASFIDSIMADTVSDKLVTDTITDVIATIFGDVGDTVDKNYMVFSYKGKAHLVVMCNEESWRILTDMIKNIRESGANINTFLIDAIENQLVEI